MIARRVFEKEVLEKREIWSGFFPIILDSNHVAKYITAQSFDSNKEIMYKLRVTWRSFSLPTMVSILVNLIQNKTNRRYIYLFIIDMKEYWVILGNCFCSYISFIWITENRIQHSTDKDLRIIVIPISYTLLEKLAWTVITPRATWFL